ncbi:MAG TPA: hypothetical protein VJV03_10120 [Pyrinomonadaceae bacterium]|nr:hypothetical protein [Pyrinomonadaceae bacterium]
MSKPSYQIVVFALADRGNAFELESDGYAGGKKKNPVRAVGVRVREQSMANQAVQVFRRAAILCGAPGQSTETSGDELTKVSGRYNRKGNANNYLELKSDGTFTILEDGQAESGNYKVNGTTLTLTSAGTKEALKARLIGNAIANDQGVVRWERQTDSETSKPGSASASRMTNAEVIELVNAGLSEQVIITAIRQAATKDFDVTPTGLIALKKAKVPDAVIVVMQEKGAPEKTSSASDTKTPPKYDATLTKQTGSTPQDGCSGIEAMGIFKNTAIDPAIGGGIVEWLAKIRKNRRD